MKRKTRDIILGSLFLALAIIMPYIFHATGISGQIFLPMHIPIIIGGFFLSPMTALMVGALSPLINSLVLGMPVFYPIGLIMTFELMVYGLSIALLRKKLDTYYSLLISMILGRITAGLVVFALQNLLNLKLNYMVYVKGAVITGLPGILIQLLLIPIIVKALKRSLRR